MIDIHYWKSGEVLKTSFPVEFESKPKVLCHFNPYDINKSDWKDYNAVVVGNESIQNNLPTAHLIPYAIDLELFKFNPNYTEEKIVNMVVNRIEGKKGVLEVAMVCKELGYKLLLVGNVSDADYINKVLETDVVEFHENISNEDLRDIYYKSAVHVCNSIDNFESGTLPILEAMACGVPVLTRNIGHVPDLADGGNMLVRAGLQDDLLDLKARLSELMENRTLRENMRDRGWKTAKNRYDKKMARQFSMLYNQVFNPDLPLVSIIIPTFNRGKALADCIAAAANQSYPAKEIIIADSGSESVYPAIKKFRELSKVPIKYVRFEANGNYSLAEARNRAIVEAEGEFVAFCDDRLAMDSKAIEEFMKYAKAHTFFWGIKDASAKAFVENFSLIRRADLIRAGMFCERVNVYGGMSEEVRKRFTEQGFGFELIETANAKTITKSTGSDKKKQDTIEAKLLIYKMYG